GLERPRKGEEAQREDAAAWDAWIPVPHRRSWLPIWGACAALCLSIRPGRAASPHAGSAAPAGPGRADLPCRRWPNTADSSRSPSRGEPFAGFDTDIQHVHDAAKERAFNVRRTLLCYKNPEILQGGTR
ncbi:hypothetical protein WDZ92_40200, partial [Nostoc sp. NIES-2111]